MTGTHTLWIGIGEVEVVLSQKCIFYLWYEIPVKKKKNELGKQSVAGAPTYSN